MTISTDGLACCPFCGNDKCVRVLEWHQEPGFGYYVCCDAGGFDGMPNRGCGASGAWGETEGEAIAAWNRRSGVEGREAVIEECAKVAEKRGKEVREPAVGYDIATALRTLKDNTHGA